MDIDRLIKLVKLANNNPNDNEANLAARKVCKMIAEADYKFVADVKVPYHNQQSNPTGRWSGFRPPPQQAKPKTYYYDESADFNIEDLLRNLYGSWPPKQPPRTAKETAEANKKVSKTRKCSKCGLEVDTFSVKEPFVCFGCGWI